MRPIFFFLISLTFFSCQNSEESMNLIEPGISLTLAEQRKADIKDVVYNISFTIPNQLKESITGVNTISLNLKIQILI